MDEHAEVKDFVSNGQWNRDKLQASLSDEIMVHIMENIKLMLTENEVDKAWWMGETSGAFTVKSAFNILRRKRQKQQWPNNIWFKGLALKISFFFWRA